MQIEQRSQLQRPKRQTFNVIYDIYVIPGGRLTFGHRFDAQAVNVIAAIALLAVEHFSRLLAAAAFDAAFAIRALPIVVAHTSDHPVRHLNTAGMHCKLKELNNLLQINNIFFNETQRTAPYWYCQTAYKKCPIGNISSSLSLILQKRCQLCWFSVETDLLFFFKVK